MQNIFTFNDSMGNNFFAENIAAENRRSAVSVRDMYGSRMCDRLPMISDTALFDANFTFLTTSLAKLHETLYEPMYWVTYEDDIDVVKGGGFVDYVEFYSVDWAGIMNQYRNIVGNTVDNIPRVNADIRQNRVNVYTYEVAYDLKFVELEKAKKATLSKSLQEIYNNAIVAGWDLFVQATGYLGIGNAKGLFNSDNIVVKSVINNTSNGFEGMDDTEVVAVFNSMFLTYLRGSHNNLKVIPNRILVPTFVQSDLISRFSALYTSTFLDFLQEHNMGTAQKKDLKLEIVARPELDDLGVYGKGRIVVYNKNKSFVRMDVPYPIQQYITLPNIDKFCYTTAFVGQVSEIQMPYNQNAVDLGIVTYWDFQN